MNNWPAKKRILFFSAAFLVLVAVLTLASFLLLGKIRQDGQTMVIKKKEAENFFANWKNIEYLKKDYEDSYQAFWKEPSLLTEETQLDFIESLEDIARANNVQQNIEILSKKVQTNSEPLNFKISVWGSFDNFMRYLICLENNPFYNDAASIQIDRMDEAGTTKFKDANVSFAAGDINAIINISVYQK